MGNIDVKRYLDIYNKDSSYDEVRKSKEMQTGLHLLCVSGSISYGTNTEESDLDIRGVVGLPRECLLGLEKDIPIKSFSKTDTELVPFRHFLSLISNGNPTYLALVGQNLDDYLYLSDLGKLIVERHTELLGARSVYESCVGYSVRQLRQLQLAELKGMSVVSNEPLNIQEEKEDGIKLNILKGVIDQFEYKYESYNKAKSSIEFIIDKETERVKCTSFNLPGVDSVDLFNICKDLKNTIDSFGLRGKRNTKKTPMGLSKHCMHTVRGLMMGAECLTTGKVRTYMDDKVELLREIRAGKFMGENGRMNSAFYDYTEELLNDAKYAYKHTVLPINTPKEFKQELLELYYKNSL